MSEGTHSNPAPATGTGSRRKAVWLAAGTALALVAGGVWFQFFRAPAGISAENPRGTAQGESGRATLRSQHAGRPLAKVGDRVITYDEVAEECVARHGNEVLDKLINRTIIQVACDERGVVVTADEVNREIVEIARKFNLTVENWLQMLQAERNLTPQQYQRDVIWPMVALRKLAGGEVVVTEEDMQKGFQRDYGPRVQARMILLDNQRRAMEVWDRANRTPDDFGALARQYSIEPSSRALEGDIPPIRRHAGNEKLEQHAFRLKPGEISPVIEIGTPDARRFVILKCEGRTEPVVKNIEEVREALYKQIQEEKTQVAVARVFEQLKEETRVDNYATNTTTGGNQPQTGEVRPAAGTRPGGAEAGQVRPAGGAPARSAEQRTRVPQ